MDRPSFSPAAPFAIGVALAAVWLTFFPALSWLLPRTDALIGPFLK
ncbi:hypothetical protein [uncultured Sphingobium sp.]|nr:hypothetical protein [uncultured Sphingobium sp.]